MAAKGNKFDNILDDVAPRTTALPKPKKPQQVNVHLDPELKKRLDRVIHHKGKKGNQKTWLAAVIQAAVEADPHSLIPVPGEDE